MSVTMTPMGRAEFLAEVWGWDAAETCAVADAISRAESEAVADRDRLAGELAEAKRAKDALHDIWRADVKSADKQLTAERDRLAGELAEARAWGASRCDDATDLEIQLGQSELERDALAATNTALADRLARCRESLQRFRGWMDGYVYTKDETGKPHTDDDTRSIFAFIDQCLAETETLE